MTIHRIVGNCCDALRCSGPHARYTDEVSEFYSLNSPWPEGLGNLVKLHRAGDRALQLLLFNEEFLVVVIHQIATITSLPFVHTARRYYRLNGLVRPLDRLRLAGNGSSLLEKLVKLGHLEEVKVVTRSP
jgi:hypothetical protein